MPPLLFGKPSELIGADDLQALVDEKCSEGPDLEFKAEAPGGGERADREFLADVTAFANARGGHIVYGVREEGGVAEELVGLAEMNFDAAILRLTNLIRDSVSPRLLGLELRAIPLANGRFSVLCTIPRSWSLPHMVRFKGFERFFTRTSAGRHPLDVDELRALFTTGATASQSAQSFRVTRIAEIAGDRTPIPLVPGPRVILHAIPLSIADPASSFDLGPLPKQLALLYPIYAAVHSSRFNFEGYLAFDLSGPQGGVQAYTQVFRSGSIETVTRRLLRRDNDPPRIPSVTFELECLRAAKRLLQCQDLLGVAPPIALCLTVLDAKGFEMAVGREQWYLRDEHVLIERDDLLVQPVLIESFSANAIKAFRPALDAVWNAAGFSGSPNFDDEGNWQQPQR